MDDQYLYLYVAPDAGPAASAVPHVLVPLLLTVTCTSIIRRSIVLYYLAQRDIWYYCAVPSWEVGCWFSVVQRTACVTRPAFEDSNFRNHVLQDFRLALCTMERLAE